MKLTNKILVLIFVLLTLATVAHAQSPREQLQQMVEQLQKNPSDNSLREKIIRLAQEIKPPPAVPEEAERHMGYGTAAFMGAKSLADYKESVKAFEQATLAAPWYGEAYFNLGMAQDKAENYEAALRSLNLARLALPDSKDIKALIYQVEYRNKKAHSPEVVAGREREKDGAKVFQAYVGRRYVCQEGKYVELGDGETKQHRRTYEIRPNGFFLRGEERGRRENSWRIYTDSSTDQHHIVDGSNKSWMEGRRVYDRSNGFREISDDGNTVIAGRIENGREVVFDTCYPR